MRMVLNTMPATERICSGQSFRPQEQYRMTTHCVQIPCEDGILLYHTLTGALMLLGRHETAQEHTEELVRRRFMVPVGFDDNAYALGIRRIVSLLNPRSDKRKSFTVLTTTDCNARCFYCYELGCRRLTMSTALARDAADYIARVSGGEPVKLSWFGGEPLYNMPAIDVICNRLAELGTEYTSFMATNGYLLDEDTVSRAVNLWRLNRVQITVDGTKERYQKTKAYIYRDDNAYERVLQNMDRLLRHGIAVAVRMNMNRENADDLLLLSDELAERFGGKDGFSAYPVLLKEFVGKVGAFTDDSEAIGRFTALRNRLTERGLLRIKAPANSLPVQRCMADNDACEVIKPDGTVGKCEHYDEADLIGTIYTEQRDQAAIAAWKEPVTTEECRACPMFPQCIQLKKCSWSKDGCSRADRAVKLMKLKESVLTAYQKNKTNGEST